MTNMNQDMQMIKWVNDTMDKVTSAHLSILKKLSDRDAQAGDKDRLTEITMVPAYILTSMIKLLVTDRFGSAGMKAFGSALDLMVSGFGINVKVSHADMYAQQKNLHDQITEVKEIFSSVDSMFDSKDVDAKDTDENFDPFIWVIHQILDEVDIHVIDTKDVPKKDDDGKQTAETNSETDAETDVEASAETNIEDDHFSGKVTIKSKKREDGDDLTMAVRKLMNLTDILLKLEEFDTRSEK